MAVVHLRAGLASRADDLEGAVDERVRRKLNEVAGMGEGRDAGLGGKGSDLEIFLGVCSRGIADQQPDADRAVGEIGREPG